MSKEVTMVRTLTVNFPVTFDVEEVIRQLREDNRDIHGEMEITLDDVLAYCQNETLSMYRNARWKDLITHDDENEEVW
jgi:hypothetical protein